MATTKVTRHTTKKVIVHTTTTVVVEAEVDIKLALLDAFSSYSLFSFDAAESSRQAEEVYEAFFGTFDYIASLQYLDFLLHSGYIIFLG
jgi:hypothetical protein